MIPYHTQGNTDILKLHKTAFLCSRRCTADIVLKSYDWAIKQREKGNCIMSGFHSKIEKDVLHYLLKGSQPVILALARGFKKRLEPEIKKAFDNNQLLIITPFEKKVEKVTAETADIRNRLMAELADEIFIAYAQKGGNLENLISEWLEMKKPIHQFSVPL
ncbi:DNA-binding protein [Candidatus Desantisbacteria bacterium]|nr:DNA-binding protein [Candidatus Desantisbacteria bacterium]